MQEKEALTFQDRLFLVFIILASVSIRLFYIDDYTYMADDAWHVVIADHASLWDVITFNYANNAHPPLYYILLHYLLAISDHPTFIRSTSLITWLISLPILYRIGMILCDKWMGMSLVLLGSLGGSLIILSLDIREYALLWLFLCAQFYFFLQLYSEFNKRTLLWYTLTGILALLTQYSAVLTITITGLLLLHRYALQRRNFNAVAYLIAAHVCAAALFGLSYFQHGFHTLAEHTIEWRNNFYFAPLHLVLIIFSGNLMDSYMLNLGGLVLFIVGLLALAKYQRMLLTYALGTFTLGLALHYMQLYPITIWPRHITWMQGALIITGAYSLWWGMQHIPRCYRYITLYSVAFLMLFACALKGNAFLIENAIALKHEDYQRINTIIEKANTDDLILSDLQTAMLLHTAGTIRIQPPNPKLSTHRTTLYQTPLYYPAWYYTDQYETKTGKRVGGLKFSDSVVNLLLNDTSHASGYVWMLSIGYMPDFSASCRKVLDTHNALPDNATNLSGIIMLYRLPIHIAPTLRTACTAHN